MITAHLNRRSSIHILLKSGGFVSVRVKHGNQLQRGVVWCNERNHGTCLSQNLGGGFNYLLFLLRKLGKMNPF